MHNNLIVFDLDGVILESLEAKTDAFSELYNEYGENIVSKVVIIIYKMVVLAVLKKFFSIKII